MHIASRFALSVAALILASACSTIHFSHGEVDPDQRSDFVEWHHNVALQLVEVTRPVDMAQRCPETDWVRVTTELRFVGALANHVSSGLWTPWTVGYSCGEDQATTMD